MSRLAILGLGRSGVSAAKAAKNAGYEVVVVDEKPASDEAVSQAASELTALGIDVKPGWKGGLFAIKAPTVVTSPGVSQNHPLLQGALEDGLEVISEIELAYRIAKDPIVAITGTNGKSTTTVMAWLCAKACGWDAVLCGNIYGSGYDEVPLVEAASEKRGSPVPVDLRPGPIVAGSDSPVPVEPLSNQHISAGSPPVPVDLRSGPIVAGSDSTVPVENLPQQGVSAGSPPVPVELRSGPIVAGSDSTVPVENLPKQGISAGSLTGTVKPPRVLIAEISSFQLEWVDQFRPKAAVITNISPDHLNRHGTFDAYVATKRRIFNRMGPADSAVWRAADTLTEPPAGIRTLTFGPFGDDAWTDERRLHLLGGCIDLAELPFEGAHNALNAMAAALLVRGLLGKDAEPEMLFEGLKAFRGLAHRMERIGERNQILLINNSMCTNPAAVIASSRSLERPQRLLIGGVNKNLDFTPVGEYLCQTGHAAYLFGTDGADIARQLAGAWPVFTTLKEAFAAAITDAKPGEAVMLAPGVASTDQFADFRDRGDAFRSMAKEWLNEDMD